MKLMSMMVLNQYTKSTGVGDDVRRCNTISTKGEAKMKLSKADIKAIRKDMKTSPIYIEGLKRAIKILERRKKFLIKDKEGWSEKDKQVASTEIEILQGLLEDEVERSVAGRKKNG